MKRFAFFRHLIPEYYEQKAVNAKDQISTAYLIEYDLLFYAKKSVCILFSGWSRRSSNPSPLYMNTAFLIWTECAKHLDSIATHDLTESEEIAQKRNDFIGRANSVISELQICCQKCVFKNLYVTMLGSQAWKLDSKSITV